MSSDELCEHGHPIVDCHEAQAIARDSAIEVNDDWHEEKWPADMPERDYHTIIVAPPETDSARYIIDTLLPRFVERFVQKNRDYKDQHRYALGPKAEWVGIDRKVAKLEQALWEGVEPVGESVEEMLNDVIGQCLLILDLLDGHWEPRSRVARKAP